MLPALELTVYDGSRRDFVAEIVGPMEVGRQRAGEAEPYVILHGPGAPARFVIARFEEGRVSRRHALLEPLPGGAVRVTNTSQAPLPHGGGGAIPPGASLTLKLRGGRAQRASSAALQRLRSMMPTVLPPSIVT